VILTVALDVTLDVYYTIDSLSVGAATRVSEVLERAGGKGINIARILADLGEDPLAFGVQGGMVGAAVGQDLRALAMQHVLVQAPGQTRRSLSVMERSTGEVTRLDEVGASLSDSTWQELRSQVVQRLPEASVLILAGDPPPGLPATALAELVQAARAASVPVILDSDGLHLRNAVNLRPEIIKVRAADIITLTGQSDPVAAAHELLRAGAESVVVSLGAGEMCMISAEIGLIARPTKTLRGSTRGAGEAAVAALAVGLTEGFDWEQALVEAVAISAAAVAHPTCGSFDPTVHQAMRAEIQVEEIIGERLPADLGR
jgi:tagatose 6-phosphate kinase